MSAWQEIPGPGPLLCFKCGEGLHGVVWEAVTKDRRVVCVCPRCSHDYSRTRQRDQMKK